MTIKLYNGMKLEAEVQPAKDKFIYYKGKEYRVSEYVKFKLKVSRYAKDKVNNMRDLILYEFKEESEDGEEYDDSDGGVEHAESDGEED